jgi:hypothetical protein
MTTLLKYFLLALVLTNLVACGVLDYVMPKGLMEFVSPKGNKLSWDGVTMSTLPAVKWFATRGEMEKTYPQSVIYKSFEVAPGQTLRIAASDLGSGRVSGVMMYADYLTPGEHRIRVDQLQGAVLVQLGTRDFTVTAQPPK